MTSLIKAYLSLLGRFPVFGLILMAAVSVIVGDYAAKAWSLSHGQREWYLFLAFAGYFFLGFFYVSSLLREGLIVTSVLWVLLSAVGFLVIGIVIFKETLSLTFQYDGEPRSAKATLDRVNLDKRVRSDHPLPQIP